ncbi:MAG: TonB-dependent receptor [Prevotella sp.]|nr:TonB-dependent receptor [Prevotella sp.]
MKKEKATRTGRMDRIHRLMLTFSFLMLSTLGFAQSKVSGTVVDASGEPVIGASVIVKGTSTGTVTDFDGNFTIPSVPANASLEISYIGYKTQTIPVAGKSTINVTLQEDAALLDEVVVVGYGVQKKSDVTGALTRVNEEQLNSRPVSNALEALQGKAAGVDITSSERPGTMGSITIRGTRSLNASNSPLYVVDGIPMQSGGIDDLNPRDIEAIDILKDASSTAIYGSRGANGVVLITTKRGKEGKMQLSYSGSFTFEKLVDKSPSMSASDYITWRRWAYYNADPENNPRGDQPNQAKDQDYFSGDPYALANVNKGWAGGSWNGDLVSNTDWGDFVTQTGITQEHTVRGQGGTKDMQGSFSFGYLDNDGTQKGQKYKRYNLALTTDIQATKWFKLGGSINASWSEQKYGFSRTGQSSGSGPTDIYNAAKALPNYTVPYDDQGNIIEQPGGTVVNQYTVIDEWTKSTDNRQYFRAIGSLYAQVDFGNIWEPLKGLQYKFQFGPDFRHQRAGIYLDESSATRRGSTNFARRQDNRYFSWTADNMLLYNNTFGEHNLGVTLLHSASKYNHESGSMSSENIYMSTFLWNNLGDVDVTESANKAGMSTGLSENSLMSYMARVNYSYKERYLLTVSGRWDGSSVLAEGHKWAFFPSFALGWRMEQESFLKDVNWLDQLKLRFGIGTTGNSSVSAYGTLGTIQSFYMPFSTGNGRILVTNEPFYTNSQVRMANKDLGWEKTTQYNLGIDFSFFRGRINGAIDVYTSRTKDLLMAMNLPSLTGYPSMMANIGETKNKGFDLTLNFIPIQTASGFEWNSTINAAFQKDEIVELANGKEDDLSNNWFIGESISVAYAVDNDGLWQESDAAEMAKFNENGYKFTAGSVKPVDQNGDYKIDDEDKIILGNYNPRWTLGWSNTFSYKGLELTIDLFGRFKYMVYTGGEGQYGMYNQREIDYWTPNNTGADWQKPVYSTAGGDAYSSLLGYKDASFIKVRNLSLGYRFDKKTLDKIGFISAAKVYVQGRNLGMLYSSVDFMDLDTGATFFNRGFTVGLQLDF